MIKIFFLNLGRNKFGVPGKSAGSLKKDLWEKNPCCNFCKRVGKLSNFDLDHITPVRVGGHLFSTTNLQLLCSNCHRGKTSLDKKAIEVLKKIGLISSHTFFASPEKVYSEFWRIRMLILKSESVRKIWMEGKSMEDYVRVSYNENREEVQES